MATAASLRSAGPGLWFCKGTFNLGEDGTGNGLQYPGLRNRLLDRVEADGASQLRESTEDELFEEREALAAVSAGKHVPFELDTAMTVIRHDSDQIMLRSVVPFTEALASEVRDLGRVTSLVVACLQHWLFVPEWKAAFPDATVYITPAALGEDLRDKLGSKIGGEAVELRDVIDGATPQISPDIEQLLFRGAPLNMNETIMFHRPSRTLIVDDAFYGGYSACCNTSWFQRSWFKATKNGSFRSATLPSYRTERVHTHGDVTALVDDLKSISQWDFDQIVYTHGQSLCNVDAKAAFLGAWEAVVEQAALKRAKAEALELEFHAQRLAADGRSGGAVAASATR